jgi:hypothetical protein
MKPTDRIIYERGFGPGDGDSHVERVEPAMTVSPSPELVDRLRKRAEIRRQIPGRKSVVEGAPDRISDLLEEAADALESAQAKIARLTTVLEAIRDYAPVESKDGTGPYTQIAVFARNTARAALKDSPNVGT